MTPWSDGVSARIASSEADLAAVIETISLAFQDDPTWSWAFPDPQRRMDQHRQWWGIYVHSALPHGRVWLTDDGAAASVWIPPGEPELSEEDEALLGTHPDHRGKGKGMGLLAENLAEIDELGMPAYLESSNRANDHRYERLGFELIGEFAAPGGEPTVGCMWREPR
jgi:GNAT superfamily N-acetyltransferase